MISLKKLILFLCLAFPISMLAQNSIVGTWKVSAPDGTGFTVTIKADNTYAVDVGMDGATNWTGKYTLSGNKMTIQDVGSDCDAKGEYTYSVTATELTMTMVKDDCSNRGNPNGAMVMTRQ